MRMIFSQVKIVKIKGADTMKRPVFIPGDLLLKNIHISELYL